MADYDYIRDGSDIYRRSFAIIRSEANLARFSKLEERIAVRLIHACGMTDIVDDIAFSETFAERGINALQHGAPILCDVRMVANGVTRSRLPANNEVICTLQDEQVPQLAKDIGTTRTAAAMELWRDKIGGSIVVIGNAPTALYRLFEMLDEGIAKPAAIIGMPVGFVGAVESKDELANRHDVPWGIVRGRKGGSAMAVATLNALASDRE
ncbi:MAG: precorrin-8X methylmutase [Hyphomicrobiaceae bacterium]